MPFWEDFGTALRFFYGPPEHPGNLAGMHLHPHYEVLFVATPGKQTAQVNGQFLPQITHPSIYVFAPFSMHRVQFDPQEKVERFIFYFSEQNMKEFPDAFAPFHPYSHTVFTRFPLSPSLLSEIYPYLVKANHLQKNLTFTKYNFFALFQLILQRTEPELLLNQSTEVTLINDIIDYMAAHCGEKITADDVCKIFFISRSKLNKIFEKNLSIGFHSLLSEMKLSQAFFMLKYQPLSITKIAEQLGFSKESYFFTFFKKATGITPLQYRRQYAAKKASAASTPPPPA